MQEKRPPLVVVIFLFLLNPLIEQFANDMPYSIMYIWSVWKNEAIEYPLSLVSVGCVTLYTTFFCLIMQYVYKDKRIFVACPMNEKVFGKSKDR